MNNEQLYEIEFQKLTSTHSYTNNMNYHIHNFYEIYLLLDGDVNFYIKDSCYHMISNSVAIINGMEPHKLTNNTYLLSYSRIIYCRIFKISYESFRMF